MTKGKRLRTIRASIRRMRSAPLVWLTIGGGVLMIAIAIGTALTVDRFRQNAIDYGHDNLERAVLLLARHFDRQFQDYSVLQNNITAELERYGFESPDTFRSEMGTLAVHETLRAKASGSADVAGANVFDANGVLINSSLRWPVADIQIGDRKYFQTLKNDPAKLEEVEVVSGRFGGSKAVVFSRRVSGPHGEFLGIVTRAIAPDLLEAFFASAGLGDGSSIAMHHRDGQLVARFPHVESLIGKNFRDGPPDQIAIFENESLITRLTSPVDGKDRLLASRMLTDKPLLIVATTSLDSALATWRTQTKFFLATAAVSIGLLVLTLYLIFRQMTWQLSMQKQRLYTAMNTMSQGLLMFDQDARLVVCNRRFVEMYGLSPALVKPGATLREILRHRQDTGSFIGDVDAYCDAIVSSTQPKTRILASSHGRMIQVRVEPSTSGGWLATHEDVTERLRAEQQIAHLAHYDALTDLPNRTQMRRHVDQQMMQRGDTAGFSVLYIDLDEFKAINDSLGHDVGDEVLRQMADRLRGMIGNLDLAVRLGGDEFAIVLNDNDRERVTVTAQKVLAALSEPIQWRRQQLVTSASIGIAIAPDDGSQLDDLLRRADLAMYAVKSAGGSAVSVFKQELEAVAQRRREIESDLRQALTHREFEIHYQPLVSLATGAITGCEALLRWRHPVHGMISPADFVPIAEETGLIEEIGEWVLKQACNEAAQWPAHIKIAVNISAVQFRSRSLGLKVATALSESGLSPRRLELEITETVLIRDNDDALTTLHHLRDLGVGIALDDFGTGYSSLSYLHRFPFSKIKIDRCFVSDLGMTDDSTAIVKAVVDMATSRGIATTAEGVETTKQREVLAALGCTEMQGYLFSPAIPSCDLGVLMHRNQDVVAA
jgi:diguanylate cyclase (GGDEF)-like protein/PAS domain S-box-containing protein